MGSCELSSFGHNIVRKAPLSEACSKHFDTFSFLKEESSYAPLNWICRLFVISSRAFDAMTSEKREIFEDDHSKTVGDAKKRKAISSKGGHKNFLVVCIKPY